MGTKKRKAPITPTTLSDISKSSGVSRWTISSILFPSEKNKHVRYSKETKAKVLAAAKRLRYRPNRSSRNLQKNRHGIVGVLTANFFNIPWQSIHAMLVAARRYGQVISFEAFSPDAKELPLFVRENVVDGLVIFESIPAGLKEAINHHDIPAVYVNACHHQPNSINMDEGSAIDNAAQYFARDGRKHLALIGGQVFEPYELERKVALENACNRLKLKPPQILSFADYSTDHLNAKQHMSALLAKIPLCDGLITSHGGFVGMAYKVCAQLGRKIPRDLGVICMQNPDMLLNFEPPVSAFQLPEAEFGEMAVEMLNRLITGEKEIDEVLLPYKFIVRR